MGVHQVYLFALSIYAISLLKNEAIFCYSNLIFSFTNTYPDKLYVQERTVNIPGKKKSLKILQSEPQQLLANMVLFL